MCTISNPQRLHSRLTQRATNIYIYGHKQIWGSSSPNIRPTSKRICHLTHCMRSACHLTLIIKLRTVVQKNCPSLLKYGRNRKKRRTLELGRSPCFRLGYSRPGITHEIQSFDPKYQDIQNTSPILKSSSLVALNRGAVSISRIQTRPDSDFVESAKQAFSHRASRRGYQSNWTSDRGFPQKVACRLPVVK